MTTATIIPTRNEGWGFFGTLASAGLDAAAGWELAMQELADLTAGAATDEACRDFLDSRMGRHLADTVVDGTRLRGHDLATAIRGAIDSHNAYRISGNDQRAYGIPRGLAYVEGWIQHFEIELELNA